MEYVINNIYRGCSHGCIYCFARGQHYNSSDFTEIHIEKDGLSVIRDEFERIAKPIVVATGGLSDPYNPVEQDSQLTRSVLELVNEFSFGICILTKSDMVVRDIDILQKIKTHSPVNVCLTITCAEDELCRIVEPYAPTSSQRFAAIREIARQGIPTGVLIDPMLPYITDTESNIRTIVKKAKDAGAGYVYTSMGAIIEGEGREYFFKKTEQHFPGITDRYDRQFGSSNYCQSPNKEELCAAFAEECERHELVYGIHTTDMITKDGRVFASILLNLSQNSAL